MAALANAPHAYDFYQTLRRLECLYPDKPRWGEALRPIDEPVRLGQDAAMSFAPAPLAAFEVDTKGAPPRLQVRLFGLLGPNGPMPLHLTEYVRERLRNANDPTLSRFLDMLQHRFMALFYRAWAQAQPHVNRDRPGHDRFAGYVGSFIGLMPGEFRNRDSLLDVAKFFHVWALVRHVRNAEGLASIVRMFFGVPVVVEEFVAHWMQLSPRDRTSLGRNAAALGGGAVVGSRVWDRQHKFRLRLGALTLAQYESFLPGGHHLQQVTDWVRLYLSFELEWDLQLVLARQEVPRLTLDRRRRLGWTTWLGKRQNDSDADDLRLHAETFMTRPSETLA